MINHKFSWFDIPVGLGYTSIMFYTPYQYTTFLGILPLFEGREPYVSTFLHIFPCVKIFTLHLRNCYKTLTHDYTKV